MPKHDSVSELAKAGILDSATVALVKSSGKSEGSFPIEVGSRFIELFSENLYSSPNKAFEELVANSWDAGATGVYIHIPQATSRDKDAVWVLDNGVSMDFEGLKLLWTITSGHKRQEGKSGRPQIGKFGIGKLATYILAKEITYVCKFADGVIRTVSLNYAQVESQKGVWKPSSTPLEVHRIDTGALKVILGTFESGAEIGNLIDKGVLAPQKPYYINEFGAPEPPPIKSTGTWTLVLLTSLKELGLSVQTNVMKRILRSALPLSSQLSIVLNGETLESSKITTEIEKQWRIGKDTGLIEIALDDDNAVPVTEHPEADTPYLTIAGIEGKIYGTMTLYKERVSGGKSEDVGASNGFFVNVLGRVINLKSPDFGLKNLSHGAWSQFRASIRADGLDKYLGVEREDLRECKEVGIFRAFLMALFNKARVTWSASETTAWPTAGDILQGSWQAIPLRPLGCVVSERWEAGLGLPKSIDVSGVKDLDAAKEEWAQSVDNNPGDLIRAVESKDLGTSQPFEKYDLATRTVIINESHPYYKEHCSTLEERRVLQDMALAEFLTELRMINDGADPILVDEARGFRHEFLRLLAHLRRRTGAHIAELLLASTNNADGFEVIVGDALEYIGFDVLRIGGSNEPEGIATAPLTPTSNQLEQSYSFSYDAKSTKRMDCKVSNKDVGAGRLKRHRIKHSADYSLVVAPDYELGALQTECQQSRVTPIRAADLAKLLMVSAAAGTMDFPGFRTLFELHDPYEVSQWVTAYVSKAQEKQHITVGDLLDAFDDIGFKGPDTIDTSVVADRIRKKHNNKLYPNEIAVRHAVTGLGILLPSIVRTNGKDIYLSAAPSAIRAALMEQLQRLPDSMRMGIDKGFSIGAP